MAEKLTGMDLLNKTRNHPAVIKARQSRKEGGLGCMEEDTPYYSDNMNGLKAKIKREKLSLRKKKND